MATVIGAPAGTGNIAGNFAAVGQQLGQGLAGLSSAFGFSREQQDKKREQEEFQRVMQGLGGPQVGNITSPDIRNALMQQAFQRNSGQGDFTLGPGQDRFKQGGQKIASGPPAISTTSQSNLIGSLGSLISEGKATPGQMKVFNRLTEKAGTSVSINNIESLGSDLKQQVGKLQEGQGILNAFTEDPANADILKNSDVNVVTNTKGQLQLEVKPKDAAASTQIKELTDLVGMQNSLTTMGKLFDKSFVGIVEGGKSARGISEATGINVIESIKQRKKVALTPKQVQFSRITNDLSDRLVRARSGAQINEKELIRLKKVVPELGLSEVAFKARMEDFSRELAEIIATKKQGIGESGKRPLGLGKKAAPPKKKVQPATFNLEDLPNLTDEQLDEMERQFK